MTLWRLVVREIRHRSLSFVLATVAVATAIACLTGAQTLLQADRVITQEILQQRQAEVATAMADKEDAVRRTGEELQDAIRKQMLKLGFNILILPAEQSRSELLLEGMSATMPESYVDKLAASSIITVNHLLPSVSKRLEWPEQQREVFLIGTRGEVPIQHRALKKQLLQEVEAGKMVVGYQIQQDLNLKAGDKVTFREQEFTISKTHAERGSTDDVTVWINLREAQEMLGMQNLINAILALECECAGDRISAIRAEITEILPGTQVIEKYSQALTRAEARAQAKLTAEEALQQEQMAGMATLDREQRARQQVEQRHADFAAVLVPLVLFAAAVIMFLLALQNVRQRMSEIGILRAIGLKARQIVIVFLSRAVLTGMLGGVVGVALGFWIGFRMGGTTELQLAASQLIAAGNLTVTLIAAPVLALILSAVASWIPALMAAAQDPASILQSDV